MALERSFTGGEIIETKQIDLNGVPIGVVKGHIATWQADSQKGVYGVPDRIIKGAYIASLQDHRSRNNRQIRLKDLHGRTIGGFPIELAKEDNIGLYGEGHINLDTQQGREAYSLARQKVLVDFSVGHIVEQDRIEAGERLVIRARLIEGSIVDEPKNRGAQISEVKSMKFADLPIVSGKYEWNEETARERVMELKFADGNGADAFVGDHLIADVVDGKLLAVPTAIYIAAEEVKSSGDKAAQVALERYYGKMEEASPFENKMFYTVSDVQEWTNAEYKNALIDTGIFSNGAVRALVARSRGQETPAVDNVVLGSLLEKIRGMTNKLNGEEL